MSASPTVVSIAPITFCDHNKDVTAVDWRALVRAEFPTAARVVYVDTENPLFVCRRAVEEAQRYYTECVGAPRAFNTWRGEIERVRARFAEVLGASPRHVALCDGSHAERQLRPHAGATVVDLSPDFGMIASVRERNRDAEIVSAHGIAAVHVPGGPSAPWACDLFANESRNVAGILALGGCLDVLTEIGRDTVASRVVDLHERLRRALACEGLAPVETRGRKTVIRTERPDQMRHAFETCGIAVSAEPEGVGVSVHLFTRDEDLDCISAALGSIRRGAPMSVARPQRPSVCVDLNGVLDAYRGWQGAAHWDPPAEGARDFLAALRARGCRIVLFTTRYYRDAWRWVETHGLAEFIDEVTDRKPSADVFLDDHAVPFEGDYDQALRQVDQFMPHWQRSGDS